MIHKPDKRDYSVMPAKNEMMIEDGWKIIISCNASTLLENAAKIKIIGKTK